MCSFNILIAWQSVGFNGYVYLWVRRDFVDGDRYGFIQIPAVVNTFYFGTSCLVYLTAGMFVDFWCEQASFNSVEITTARFNVALVSSS